MNGPPIDIECSDGATMRIFPGEWRLEYAAEGIDQAGRRLFVAVEGKPGEGSAIVPYGRWEEGSTVYLPFQAGWVYSIGNGAGVRMRKWLGRGWSGWLEGAGQATFSPNRCEATLQAEDAAAKGNPGLVAYAKDLGPNDGWGWIFGATDAGFRGGTGDKYIAGYMRIIPGEGGAEYRRRLERENRARVYQLFVRLFGNTNETRKVNGTMAENGVGKFADINDAALEGIRGLGCTHVWLTGVLRQATSTNYGEIELAADDPDLLKGLAGSPFAVTDYFDVCPDYAVEPGRRLAEFRELLERVHGHGLKAIIDIVPNHVARSYASTVRPELSFGAGDDRGRFFDPGNNFYYLRATDPGGGAPLKLPTFRDGLAVSATCRVLGGCDGFFDGEKEFGRVTGNNVVSWAPGIGDWYETVKLNYGVDFTRAEGRGFADAAGIPDTWRKMDAIIAHWQETGVDGFRCDMAHMIPAEFWKWVIGQARQREPEAWFMGEAYNDDPAKIGSAEPAVESLGNVKFSLLDAGFDAVYDGPAHQTLKRIYDGPGWANDLDGAVAGEFIHQNSIRYAENHDEARLAARGQWGGVGMEVGRPVAAILYGMGGGALLLHNGQEVGEPAGGAAGFAGDDGRTTIFDYWSMPELAKWVNGGRYDGGGLSEEQRELREYYGKLLALAGEPGFRFGEFWPLNPANLGSGNFGRAEGETAAGHWMYAFLRYDRRSGQRWMVVGNLHGTLEFSQVHIRVPAEAWEWMELERGETVMFTDRLGGEVEFTAKGLPDAEVVVPSIRALSAMYLEITVA